MSEHVKWTEENPVSDELILRHWASFAQSVAYRVRRSYSLSQEDWEDIISTIQVRLLRLPQENRPFECYVRMVITNAAREAIRSLVGAGACGVDAWKKFRTVDFESAAPSNADADSLDGTALIDLVIPASDSPEDGLLNRSMLLKALSSLKERERRCILAYYFEDRSVTDIGEELELSASAISKIVRGGVRKLRRKLSSG